MILSLLMLHRDNGIIVRFTAREAAMVRRAAKNARRSINSFIVDSLMSRLEGQRRGERRMSSGDQKLKTMSEGVRH